MEKEVGGGIGMGNTCKPMAVSFQCMTKSTTNKKKKKEKKRNIETSPGYLFHTRQYMFQGYSVCPTFFPRCVHRSILYVCVSTPTLQIGSAATIFLATKRDKFESAELRKMNLEPIIQSEVSQKEKNKCRILIHTRAFNESDPLGDNGKSAKLLCACLL